MNINSKEITKYCRECERLYQRSRRGEKSPGVIPREGEFAHPGREQKVDKGSAHFED